MPGPWEQFQPQSAPATQGPWSNFQPPAEAPAAQSSWQDASVNLPLVGKVTAGGLAHGAIDALPSLGALAGGAAGATAGSVVPLAGTTEGAFLGTGAGAAAGSTAKDALNAFVFGPTKTAGQVAAGAANEASENILAQKAGEVIAKGLGKTANYIGSKVIPQSVIARYKQAADVVEKLMGSSNNDIATATSTVRKGMADSLDEFREQANATIADKLKDNPYTIDAQPIIEKLREAKGKIDKDLFPDVRQRIDSQIETVQKMSGLGGGDEATLVGDPGRIPVARAHELKQVLQDLATSAYREPGQFQSGSTAAKKFANAMQGAAALTRKGVNEMVPEVAAANDKLAALHSIEDHMNMRMLEEGAPSGQLIAAGNYTPGHSGGNADSARALRLLGNLTGNDFIGGAQDLAAMQSFAKDSLFRRGVGAVGGAAVGAGAAELSGNDVGHGAMVGGTLGGALTSPAAAKAAINLSRAVPSVAMPAVNQTLGQAVMHGSGAANSLKQAGGTP